MTTKAESVTPPRLLNGLRPLQLVAVTASSVAKQLDANVRNRYVRLQAEGADVDFCFGVDNTITVSNALTGDNGSTAALGWRLVNGEYVDFELSGADNFIAVQGSATGNLRIMGCGRRMTTGTSTQGP